MSQIKCPECPNKDSEMFSNAAGGKKFLCMKCYHTFYKPGEYSSRSYYASRSREEKSRPVKTSEVPDAVYVEIKFLRERLDRLENFCSKRGIIQ